MYKKIIISIVFLLAVIGLQAQNLDRITISAGGNATDEVSYSIGETFNFAVADGDIVIETGSQGSTGNTGGNNNFVKVETVVTGNNQLSVYPNPTNATVYFNAGKVDNGNLQVVITDITGKQVVTKSVSKSVIMDCDLSSLTSGNYIMSVYDNQNKIIGTAKIIKN